MFNTIYILQWDNYYDRRIHPSYSDLNDTLNTYLEKTTAVFSGINFVPNDFVNTTVVLNLAENTLGNYLLVVDNENQITSRWFIIDTIRTRSGQYQLTLRRDVITDYWNVIKQAPALIEKCNLDFDNPLIFNNEDMTVNQIKTEEVLLDDRTRCPWLVAYIAKDAPAEKLSGTARVGNNLNAAAISLGDTKSNWEKAHSTYYGATKAVGYRLYFMYFDTEKRAGYELINGYSGENSWNYTGKKDTYCINTSLRPSFQSTLTWNNPVNSALEKGMKAVGVNNLLNLVPAYATDGHSEEDVEEFLDLSGKTVVDTDGKYFEVNIEEVASETKVYDIPSGSLFIQLSNMLDNATFKYLGKTYKLFSTKPNEYSFRLEVVYNTYKTTLKPLVDLQINYSISTTRLSTEDAPYDILAVPYGRIYAGTIEGEGTIDTNAEIGLAVMQALAKNLDAACYDIQLVPYCPLQNYIVQSKTVKTWDTEGMNHYITKTVDGITTKLGVIYSVPKANFTFNILQTVYCANDSIQRKVNNDCDKWRLCSPNYSNYFDFSVEKNNGVDYFNVDCTYKPYSPYIHINPNFNGLYGQDYNDPRGLVCGGDFSLTQVRSAWESYQLQNKNFQETFDRQIQNMEISNKYARIQDKLNATVGTVQGGISGASAGAISSGGNPYAAIAAGIVGTAASAIGGVADIHINEKLRSEALDYTKDQFGYQLGNIQAIPLTLSKISAFNQNNKIFPVLEYYTCTDIEKEAYANKIAYNGMTTMAIGKIEDNLRTWEYTVNNRTIKSQNYIKARVINLNLKDGSSQLSNAISDEVYKGFYLVDEE